MSYGIKAYKSVGIKDDIAVADPHRIIQLLMQGALENMAKAKGAMERKDYTLKGQLIGKATAIISALKSSLDINASPELAQNLDALYDYMIENLIIASREMSVDKVSEVMELLLTIKSAWDQIPVSDRETAYQLQLQREQQMAVGI